MFKVPDWGNDIPKGDVDVMKLFAKKSKTKNTKSNAQHTAAKNKVINQVNNHKKTNAINKAKNRISKTSHIKLSKDEHINNRIVKRNLKITFADNKNNHIAQTEGTGKAILKGKKLDNKMDVNKNMKNKILKRKGKIPKSSENKDANKSKTMNTNQNKLSFRDKKNIDKKPQSPKRKQTNHERHDDIEINNADMQSLNTDEPDKIIVNAKRRKLNDKIKNDDIEDVLFRNKESNEEELNNDHGIIPPKQTKLEKKKEKLKALLKMDSNRNVIRTNSNKLRERMLERLKAAQFRYLNEKLYTSSGSESQELFKSDPAAFQTYHEGYQLQVKKWPVNPLDLIVKRIQKMPKTHLVADMGCGEASLSKRVPQSVRSFDLVATAPGVEACNMAHTPLLAASMDVVVFCLALMGTDLTQYLLEANRVLKVGGHLLIAEVESRFENVDTFSSDVQRLGFSLKKMDKSHQVFFFMEFCKLRDAPAKKGKLPSLSLKPCLYKRR